MENAASPRLGGGPAASTTITDRRPQAQANRAASKEELAKAARWVVHVSSTAPDGTEILRRSGFFIHWNKEEQRARILTSYRVVFCIRDERLYDPVPKLAVHLPNMDILEGRLLFFNEHYRIALLEISVDLSFEVELPFFGCSPCYDQEVFTLARDKDMSFKHRHGTVMWLEENHFLFLDCKLPRCGIGGPVINNVSDLIGMSSDHLGNNAAIISITTILTCVEMLKTFSRIARPLLGMCFRTVEFLDIARMDQLRWKYGIRNGFIVNEVTHRSTAEKLGIRRGDVIVSFNGISCYLPQFEDFLLSLGLDFLRGMKTVNDFKLEVHDLLGKVKRTITLPVQFSDASEY